MIPLDAVEINNNIVWNHDNAIKVEFHFLESKKGGVIDWATWQKTGLDKNSLLTDPRLCQSGTRRLYTATEFACTKTGD